MSQLKDFMQGKGGATWSFTRGMKTSTALTQTIERPLRPLETLQKKLEEKDNCIQKMKSFKSIKEEDIE